MNPHHQTFVNEMILHNDAVRAYKAAYPNAQGEAARTAAHRLMKKEEIRQPITDAYKQLRLGIREDKAAFLHNELKIIDRKRKMLLELMFGTGDITPRQRMMAMKLDNELAAQQAYLLGYGSLKPQYGRYIKQPNQSRHSERREESPEHVEEAVSNRNNKKTPLLFLGGDVGRQRSSVLTGVVKCSAVLPTRVNHPKPDQPRHSERRENSLSEAKSPEHIAEAVTTKPVTNCNIPVLPMAYASPLHKEMMQV